MPARLARIVSLVATLLWVGPASAECAGNSSCPKDRPICIRVDRFGDLRPRLRSERTRMHSLCVPLAAEDGACPFEYRRDSVEYLRGRPGEIEQKRICVPVARYGAGPLWASCTADEDCQRASPYCLDGHCAATCEKNVDPPCPAIYECAGGQTPFEGKILWANICVPALPPPPLAKTPFCAAIPNSANQLIAKKGNTAAVWRQIEACALPAGDLCAAAALSASILEQQTGRQLALWLAECRARPPQAQDPCMMRSAQLARPEECKEWELMRSWGR